MPLCFRGLYSIAYTFGPVWIPAGQYPMKFTNKVITNDRLCTDLNGQEQCFVDENTKFRAPKTSWYHFEIGAHTWNMYNLGNSFWIDITVRGQEDDGSDPVTIREFKDYTPYYENISNGGRRYVVFRFEHYMKVNSKIWLENNKINTLTVGPYQRRFTWMAYQYVR